MNDALVELLLEDIKKFLAGFESAMYDEQLKISIDGGVNKLASEGVPPPKDRTSVYYNDYVICLAWQVQMDVDLDVNIERANQMYITRVNTLRSVFHGYADSKE